MLKDYLSKNNIIFEEKLVDQNETAREEMKAKSQGFQGVPFTIIVKDDGTEEGIIGFNKGKINQVLGITGQ